MGTGIVLVGAHSMVCVGHEMVSHRLVVFILEIDHFAIQLSLLCLAGLNHVVVCV